MDIIVGILIIGFAIFGYKAYEKYNNETGKKLNSNENKSLNLTSEQIKTFDSLNDHYETPKPFSQQIATTSNHDSSYDYPFNRPGTGKHHDYDRSNTNMSPFDNNHVYDEEVSGDIKKEIESMIKQRDDLMNQINNAKKVLVEYSSDSVSFFNDVGYYDFDNPAENSLTIKDELDNLKKEIKELLKSKKAIVFNDGFSYNNSRVEGEKFIAKLSNLGLMAYNSEVENAVKNIKKSNMEISIRRIERVKGQITRAGEIIGLMITDDYHSLRLKELELSYKYIIIKEEERLKEKERKDKLREEKKANDELARKKKELEDKLKKEESHYNNAIKLLQKDDNPDNKKEIIKMKNTLDEIKKGIKDVDYRAANSRAGYVYVISNIGSFGDSVVKIGMTRRLNPEDRVKELGDASVPFGFDTHLMHFSDDAVGVENKLHQHFAKQRVNLVNNRREFFYTTPQEVKKALKKIDGSVVEYNEKVDAEQFKASEKLRKEMFL